MMLMLQGRTAWLALLACRVLVALTMMVAVAAFAPHAAVCTAIAMVGAAVAILSTFAPWWLPSIRGSSGRSAAITTPICLAFVGLTACSPLASSTPLALLLVVAGASGVVISEFALGPPMARLLAALPRRATVLVVGNNKRTRHLVDRWLAEVPSAVDVVGYLDAMDVRDPLARNPRQDSWRFLGDVGEIARVVSSRIIDEVWVTLPVRSRYSEIQSILAVCEDVGLPVRLPTGTFARESSKIRRTNGQAVEDLYYLTAFGRSWQLLVKRALDVVGSAALIVLLAPLMLLVAIAVKLDSRGPVFFGQTRCGLHGRRFTLYKFRSMVDGATRLQAALRDRNQVSGPVFKIRNDPRMTRVGRLLRTTSIDELPQLFNVLKGEMSLVGPRPPVPDEVDRYEPWQRRRLSVLPGLTCTWQVSGRSEIPFERWMELDLEYAANWSVLSDLALLARTVPAVLSGRGAS